MVVDDECVAVSVNDMGIAVDASDAGDEHANAVEDNGSSGLLEKVAVDDSVECILLGPHRFLIRSFGNAFDEDHDVGMAQ